MSITPVRRAPQDPVHADRPPSPRVTLQHLGFDHARVEALENILRSAGEEAGVELVLDSVHGAYVLAESSFVTRVAPQVLNAFLEDRPLMVISAAVVSAGDASLARRELLLQLQALTLQHPVEGLPRSAVEWAAARGEPVASSGFDSSFDSELHADKLNAPAVDRDRARLLTLLRQGLLDPTAPPLAASYGRGACMRIDFSSGWVLIDDPADQRLRVLRHLPFLAAGAMPGPMAKERELDLVVWDIGLAAGGFRLRQSPVNWWRAPLVAPPRASVNRYTSEPKHLDMARCLFTGPITPADLRRRARVSIEDLRAFLQASLFLGLAYWAPQHTNS